MNNKYNIPNEFIISIKDILDALRKRRDLKFSQTEKLFVLYIHNETAKFIYKDAPDKLKLTLYSKSNLGCGSCVRTMMNRLLTWIPTNWKPTTQ